MLYYLADSNGDAVYYYMVQDQPPFTVGCFGPVSSVEDCRKLYSSCGDGDDILVSGTILDLSHKPYII